MARRGQPIGYNLSDMTKRLYRSRRERMLAGVCGGLGSYFHVDPILIRLGWAVTTLFTGVFPGVFAYLLCWLIIPEEPEA